MFPGAAQLVDGAVKLPSELVATRFACDRSVRRQFNVNLGKSRYAEHSARRSNGRNQQIARPLWLHLDGYELQFRWPPAPSGGHISSEGGQILSQPVIPLPIHRVSTPVRACVRG